MRTVLIVLTVVEIVVFLGVVAGHLAAIERSLDRTATVLGKVSFGVRAIEKQTASVGPGVTRINEQLTGIAAALDDVAVLAGAPDNHLRVRARAATEGDDG